MSYSVAISVFSLGVGGREGVVVSEISDTKMTFASPKKAENTDPHTNYAVEYATARGHLRKPHPNILHNPEGLRHTN